MWLWISAAMSGATTRLHTYWIPYFFARSILFSFLLIKIFSNIAIRRSSPIARRTPPAPVRGEWKTPRIIFNNFVDLGNGFFCFPRNWERNTLSEVTERLATDTLLTKISRSTTFNFDPLIHIYNVPVGKDTKAFTTRTVRHEERGVNLTMKGDEAF